MSSLLAYLVKLNTFFVPFGLFHPFAGYNGSHSIGCMCVLVVLAFRLFERVFVGLVFLVSMMI